MQFNAFQKEVIALRDGLHSCLAAAGSGKTEVLTERLSNISNVLPHHDILCLTFTNRAALSMKERVESKLGRDASTVFVGNTHSLALDILYENRFYPFNYSLCTADVSDKLWGLAEKRVIEIITKSLSIEGGDLVGSGCIRELKKHICSFDSDDCKLIDDVLFKAFVDVVSVFYPISKKEADGGVCYDLYTKVIPDLESSKSINFNKFDFKFLYSLIRPLTVDLDLCFSGGVNKKSFYEFVANKSKSLLATNALSSSMVYGDVCLLVALLIGCEYEALKKQLLLFDFDDALCDCLKIKSRSYRWIQIDECQDLSPIQWLVVDHHKSKDAHMMLFGDMNQSIYRFLGASVEQTGERIGRSVYELPVNYRSPENLVSLFSRYMNKFFDKRFSFNIEADNPPRENALVWVSRETQADQLDVLYRHAKKLAENNKKTAFLCPSNKAVDDVSLYLSEFGVEHFKISKVDILSKKNALDFIAFLQAVSNVDDTLSWSRLLWNFGGVESKKDELGRTLLPPQVHALELAAKLSDKKLKLSDFLSGDSVYSHALRDFQLAAEEGFVYFDTETTGLNKYNDRIVQISAVKVLPGSEMEELDLYCLSDKPVGDSEKVHNISDAFLIEHGDYISVQLEKFLLFCDGLPLIAHNLPFDEGMIEEALFRSGGQYLDMFSRLKKICSLDISRRLYPGLKTHKLCDLLELFNLEGVNSHNAIDDVRAGVNLTLYMSPFASESCVEADELIDLYEGFFTRFRSKLIKLNQEFETIRSDRVEVDLDMLIEKYFGVVIDESIYNVDTSDVSELKSKLGRWSTRNFDPDLFDVYLEKISGRLSNLKESDLITENDNMVISTIHKAKGLEFDYVILPNVVVGSIPSYPIAKMDECEEKESLLDEQKRLLYVAMTRAKKQLVIGTYNFRDVNTRYGRKLFRVAPSPYIQPYLEGMSKY